MKENVVDADYVVERERGRLRNRVDRRDEGAVRLLNAHLLDRGDIEDRRAVHASVDAARDFDPAPAVRCAPEGLLGFGHAQTGVQVVPASAPSEFVIEGKVETAAVERLLADLGMRADGAAAPAAARRVDVAVALNDGIDGGVETICAGDMRRHAEVAHSIQVADVERRIERWPHVEQRVGHFGPAQRVVRIAERDAGTERRQPGTVDARDVLLGASAQGNRIGLERAHGYAPLFPRRGSVACIEEEGGRRRVGEPAVILAPRIRIVLRRAVNGRLVGPAFARREDGTVEIELRRQDGTAPRRREPAAFGFGGLGDRLAIRRKARWRERVLDAGFEPVCAGPGGGVHGETPASIEAHGADPAALERHLLDVMARRLRRQRAEHG